ncbi:chemotaxis protein CheY [Pseudomonas sp. RW409]|uniref:chemotaxis protein CheY n=1 Tax=Pseudomonas sp. RW409 TaxID=2202895 RepID=UPI000D72D9F3|nr:chemotaxis protein CheY [Pseudomonas sp. RW409]PWY53224.1 chemotaxis protein CheY [Pseudomonas sp. RW409]
MTNKALRILIADERHEQLLHIEKLLNRLDYYRIAPIRTFDELALLTSGPQPSFDLLIVNKALALPHGVDMQQFCRARPQIRHALFYDSPAPSLELMLHSPDQPVRACLADAPDADSLSVLMSIIDPPSQWASLKALPWLHAPVRA